MNTIEEVKTLQSQGKSEEEIITSLREKGIPYKEISESLSQSKIKAAVEEPARDPRDPSGVQPPTPSTQAPSPLLPEPEAPSPNQGLEEEGDRKPKQVQGMQQSIMQTELTGGGQQPMTQEYGDEEMQGFGQYDSQEYSPQYQNQDQYYQDEQYADYGGQETSMPVSTDTITEISEQIVAEKMSATRKHLNKVMDFKTVVESKIESIDERLEKIERIINTLQSSVLRKVGDYITNVNDIKKELIQTQKSFTKLVPELKKRTLSKKTTRKRTTRKKKK